MKYDPVKGVAANYASSKRLLEDEEEKTALAGAENNTQNFQDLSMLKNLKQDSTHNSTLALYP